MTLLPRSTRGAIHDAYDHSPGIVIRDEDGSVRYYGHNGIVCCVRHEVSVCRDQSQARFFRPMRLYLPYGRWRCDNGTEVLFNRDYRPLWQKSASGTITVADPDEWITFSRQEWFFGDTNSPDANNASLETLLEHPKRLGCRR